MTAHTAGTLTAAQREILTNLIHLRHQARKSVATKQRCRTCIDQGERMLAAAIGCGDRMAEARARIDLESMRELMLDVHYESIHIGQVFTVMAPDFDTLPREVWLRALAVNESEWDTDRMRKYGKYIVNVVTVLDLENSAMFADSTAARPLNWCLTMAQMNAIATNPRLGEQIHDKCNEFFGGAFGQWREPSLLQRLGATA
jgi:hypothetical protein